MEYQFSSDCTRHLTGNRPIICEYGIVRRNSMVTTRVQIEHCIGLLVGQPKNFVGKLLAFTRSHTLSG
jgi:hypothetical protein